MPDLTAKKFTEYKPYALLGEEAHYKCDSGHRMQGDWSVGYLLKVDCLAGNQYQLPELEDIPDCIPYVVCSATPAYPSDSSGLVHDFDPSIEEYKITASGLKDSVEIECPSDKFQLFDEGGNKGDALYNSCQWDGPGHWAFTQDYVDTLECRSTNSFWPI